MKKELIFILIFAFNIHFGQETKMTTAEISNFKAKVIEEAKSIKTLQTDFVQYKHLEFMSKDIETSGKMFLESPSTLLWQYTKPYQYKILFKDKKIHIDDKGKKSSFDAKGKLFENINKMVVSTLNGNVFDEKTFDITFFKNKTHHIVKLNTKEKNIKKYIKTITLKFLIDEYDASEVLLMEPSDDYTKIVFKNRKKNAKMDQNIFNP